MTKTELVKAAAMEAGITQADAGRVIDCLVRGISAAVQKDGRFELGGFGVFKLFRSAAVSRPNPQDRSKIIHTPERNTVKFSPAPALKKLVA